MDPQISSLINDVRSVLRNKDQYKRLLASKPSDAQRLLDCFQWLLDTPELDSKLRRSLIVATQRLSKKSGLYPTCYELKDVIHDGQRAVNAGGFADIYKGIFRGQVVCIKMIRLYQQDVIENLLKKVTKEAILWGQLTHPNVLAFYGLYRFERQIGIILPWMKNEDLVTYLKKNPDTPRKRLAGDVANGLSYLHKFDIIHGDIKGSNILVDDLGRALLTDFGISSVSAGSEIVALTSQSSVASKGGTVRWQAPELFDVDDEEVKNSFESDVYSYGCVCFQIFTGEFPFADIHRDSTIISKVQSGARPKRPHPSSFPWNKWGLTEEIWLLMEGCWKKDPSQRPSAAELVQQLTPLSLSDPAPVSELGGQGSAAGFRRQISNPLQMHNIKAINDTLHEVIGVKSEILASLLPTDRPQSRQSSQPSASQTSLINSSNGISLHVIPPDNDAASVTSSQLERRSSREDSTTIHSGNKMSSQTFMVLSAGANGSRPTLVLPASPSLLPGVNGSTGSLTGASGSQASSVLAASSSLLPDPGANFSQRISDYIYPLMPYKVPECKRKRLFEDMGVIYEVEADQDTFSMGGLPDGWKQLTHPEGQPYFYHPNKRIITGCWIWDQQMFNIINGFIDRFENFTSSQNLTQPDDADLLLEVNIEEGKNWCGYYYVSASTRSVFWLEPVDILPHISENRGKISAAYIKLYLEYQYWYHWDLFPDVNSPSEDIYDLVANTITNARTDLHTSRYPKVTQSAENIREMADIIEDSRTHKSSSSLWYLGHFMRILMEDQIDFKFDDVQAGSLQNKKSTQTLFKKMLSPVLTKFKSVRVLRHGSHR